MKKIIAIAAVLAVLAGCKKSGEPVQPEPQNPTTVELKGITLSEEAITLEKGGSTALGVVFDPADATDKTLTWLSSNPSVATVSDGVVTGVGAGETEISVKAGNCAARCKVTVTVSLKGIQLQSKIEIYQGETATLTATLEPSDATAEITWESSDESVVTVSEGLIRGVRVGDATVTAKAGSFKAECAITVILATDCSGIDPDAAAKVMKQWKVLTSDTEHGSYNYIRDFGYTFRNYSIYWEDFRSDYVAQTLNGGRIVAVSYLSNGWIKLEWDDVDYFALFRNVTETTAEYMLYYTEDYGMGYPEDEYGWPGFSAWNSLSVCDPPYPLTFKQGAFKLPNVGNYPYHAAVTYPSGYDAEEGFFNDVMKGSEGSLPNIVVINGYGTAEDFEKAEDQADVTGKVVLLSRGSNTFAEKLKNAVDYGAVAVLCVNNAPGLTYPDVSALPAGTKDIPFFLLSQDFGKNFGMNPGGKFFCQEYGRNTLYFVYATNPQNFVEIY